MAGKTEPSATRNAYGEALVELGEAHEDVVALDADLSVSTQSAKFGNKFPDRFFNGRADAWEGDEARAMKADFIAACESSVSGVVDCGCVFAEITSATPYDTPEGFARLHDPIWGTNAGGEPPSVPAVYVAAVRRCMGAA